MIVGALALGGSINRTVSKAHLGSIDLISSIAKRTGKTYNSSVTGTGVLSTLLVKVLSVAGSLDFTGVIYRQINKFPSGALDYVSSEFREIHIGLSTGLSSAGTAIKQTTTSFSSGLQTAGTGTFTKILAGAVKVTTYLKGMFRGMFKGMK